MKGRAAEASRPCAAHLVRQPALKAIHSPLAKHGELAWHAVPYQWPPDFRAICELATDLFMSTSRLDAEPGPRSLRNAFFTLLRTPIAAPELFGNLQL